jgi:hypothetical protein
MKLHRSKLGLAGALTLVAGSSTGLAQTFHESLDSRAWELAYAVRETADGGYVTAGLIYDQQSFNSDFHVVRYDFLGNPVWSVRYGQPNSDDYACSIQQTPDGGFIVSGNTNGFGPDLNVAAIRLDGGGNLIWSWVYQGDGMYEDATGGVTGAQILDSFSDGSAAIVGRKLYQPPAGGLPRQGGQLLRIGNNGVPLFNKLYFAPVPANGNEAPAVTFTDIQNGGTAQGFAIVGTISPDREADPTGFDTDLLVVRAAPNGAVLASRKFGTFESVDDQLYANSDQGYGIDLGTFNSPVAAPDLVIAGRTTPSSVLNESTQFLRLDAALNIKSVRLYSVSSGTMTPGSGSIREVRSDGSVALVGTSFYGDGGATAWMSRVDPNGDPIWNRFYGRDVGPTWGDAVIPPPDSLPTSGFVLAGGFNGFLTTGNNPADVYLLRSDTIGVTGCNEECFNPEVVQPVVTKQDIPLTVLDIQGYTLFEGQLQRVIIKPTVFCSGRLCAGDVNNDGVVDFGDFLAFFNGYDTFDLSADLNGDCVVDFGDFLIFFNLYDTGCL